MTEKEIEDTISLFMESEGEADVLTDLVWGNPYLVITLIPTNRIHETQLYVGFEVADSGAFNLLFSHAEISAAGLGAFESLLKSFIKAAEALESTACAENTFIQRANDERTRARIRSGKQ